ncbi:unnamed protein product, partial [Staurois parvus]
MCPVQRPRHLLRLMLASGSCVPVTVTSGRMGGGGGKFENLKKISFFFFKTILHMLCPVPCLHFDYSF